jgi:UDP-N-acetylglucosamine 2-epimerase (non-hydrolysing)
VKAVLVVGARPNFMKIAPLLAAMGKSKEEDEQFFQTVLVHTGQHYDYEMSQIFFEELKLPEPDVHLGIGSGTHAEQTGNTMIEVEKILLDENPDLLIVVGDVNATLAAALAAAKLNIPIAHIEAGIRSLDREMPEEINRLLTDHLSDYLFTTSEHDDNNLRKEGIPTEKIFRVGNIMADSLLASRETAANSDVLSRLGLKKQGYALVTLHRPSNVDSEEGLTDILITIGEISRKIPVVFPVHPRTRKNIDRFGLGRIVDGVKNLKLIEPLGYLNFLNLEMNAKMVITDSGGVQVETTILGVPCLTMLDYPVWPITHEQGTNILVGSDMPRLKEEALKIIDGKSKRGHIPRLWDGKAAERIVKVLKAYFT